MSAAIDAAYQAFDGASWSCERVDDDAMLEIGWMREAIEVAQGTDGCPRAYRWLSGAYGEGGEALHFPGIDRMGIAWGSDPGWGDADDVRLGVRVYICDPASWCDSSYCSKVHPAP